MDTPPLAIVIGAMKAGTTTLYQALSEHPQIAPSRTKEINFFRRPAPDWDHLLRNFDYEPARHRWLLDVSPNYSKPWRGTAADHIRAYPGEKRLFYILRDPIDRVLSHVAHTAKRGRWSEEERPKLIANMTDVSRYSRHIANFEEHGLRPTLLSFDDIYGNPQALLDTVTDQLGLDRLVMDKMPHRHRSKRFPALVSDAEKAAIFASLREDMEALASDHGFGPARLWLDRWLERFPADA